MTRANLIAFLALSLCCTCALGQAAGKIPQMVPVGGGTFLMGDTTGNPDERPIHAVTVSGFSIGKYEVTHREFKAFIQATKYMTDAELSDSARAARGLAPPQVKTGTWNYSSTGLPVADVDSLLPVGNVSWNDAVAYCEWLAKETGLPYRLPTEAEWEYAARGGKSGKGSIYAGGNEVGEVGWHLFNSRNKPRKTGQKKPNELGLLDMSGNAREWCSDRYDEGWYARSPEKDPKGPATGEKRVLRGGSWGSFEPYLRVSARDSALPSFSALNTGFRVALSVEKPK